MGQRSFTAKDAALTINYIGFVYRTLIAEGYLSEALLKDTGLTEAALQDPDYRCTFEQHRTFVKNAIALTGDPHLGMRMGARFNPLNIGLPAAAALSSDFFSTALKVLQQFISLNFSIVSFDYQEQADEVVMRWNPAVDVGDIEYFVVGSCLAVTENFWCLLLGEERVSGCAELSLPQPSGWDNFSKDLSFPVRFDAPFNQVTFPAEYLQRPIAGADPVMHQHMLRLCEKQLAESFYGEGVDAKLRQLIAQRHYHSVPIDQAAKELGVAERSLRRQLSESGTSYKKIVDEVRQARARELLAVAGLPISTIAYDLGFSDPSNFARSFKRWTGESPQDYRSRTFEAQSGHN